MKVKAYIHSLKDREHDRHVLGEAEIIECIGDNLYLAEVNYGVLLGKNSKDMYVTWEFHLTEDESVSAYWGHFIHNREEGK